ncbi:MAG: hypothetical protein ACXQS8_08775 [Candidatus Helarchaeales archaeon]
MSEKEIILDGVCEYVEGYPVSIKNEEGRLVIDATNEGGYNGVEIDLLEFLDWLCNPANREKLRETFNIDLPYYIVKTIKNDEHHKNP